MTCPLHRAVGRGVALAGLLLLPSALLAQRRRDDQREAPEVKQLVLSGVESVDRDELRQSLATEPSRCKNIVFSLVFCWWNKSRLFYERHYLDRDELKRDLLRARVFYWRRGWRDTEVDTVVTKRPDGVAVAFRVQENAPTLVARQTVLYDSTLLRERRVKRIAVLRAGQPLNLLQLDTTRALLQAEMWDKGYADAVVDTAVVVDTARKLADVRIAVVPNRRSTVGSITVSGNEKVAVRTIGNSLTFRTGDVFRRGDVLLSQRNLYESNLFRQATITVPPVRDSVKPVQVTVREGPHREARVGWGFTSIDYFQLLGRLTHYNLLGGARRLDVDGVVGNLGARALHGRGFFQEIADTAARNRDAFLQPTWQASIDFRQPAWLQRPENAIGFGVFTHRRAAPPVYIDRSYGGSATFTRMLHVRVPLSATYRYEITRVDASDVFFCVNYGVCDVPTIATLRSHQRLSPLLFSGISDRSDDPFNPTKGYVARAEIEHASAVTVSDYRYNRFYADGAVYKRLAGRGAKAAVLAGHLRLGVVRAMAGVNGDPTLHPRKRFYAGGSQSVRGYGESQLGPRVLTVPPEVLRGDSATASGIVQRYCPEPTPITRCDPNDPRIASSDFTPRPVGGTSVVEGSAEYRFPIWKQIGGAVFVDGAIVGQQNFRSLGDVQALLRGSAAVTPGFGVRYRSPVGAIRVDAGINPKVSEQLPVVTEVLENGVRRIVPVGERDYSLIRDKGGLAGLLQRFTLHLSIGQAY